MKTMISRNFSFLPSCLFHGSDVFRTDLNLGQLQDFGEGVDAVGVGRQRVHPLAVKDSGGHGSQSVPAQVQFLQLLQLGQFTAGCRDKDSNSVLVSCDAEGRQVMKEQGNSGLC